MGADYGFTDDDHHVYRTTIQLYVAGIENDVVTVGATFGFRDKSGNWDDRYDGSFNFTVFADVTPRPANFASSALTYNQRRLVLSPQAKALADKEMAVAELAE